MYFASGWNGFAGRTWPAGRSVENPDIDYEEEWRQHTTLSESNTNAESLWFNSVIDTDTIFWAGIQSLDCQEEATANGITTIHRTTIYRTKVHRTDSASNRQFIEPTAHRTDRCRKIAVSSVAILDYLLLCLTVNCKIFNLPTSLFSSRI